MRDRTKHYHGGDGYIPYTEGRGLPGARKGTSRWRDRLVRTGALLVSFNTELRDHLAYYRLLAAQAVTSTTCSSTVLPPASLLVIALKLTVATDTQPSSSCAERVRPAAVRCIRAWISTAVDIRARAGASTSQSRAAVATMSTCVRFCAHAAC